MLLTELLVLLAVVLLGQIELSGSLLHVIVSVYLSYLNPVWNFSSLLEWFVSCVMCILIVFLHIEKWYAYSLTPLCVARVGMEL